MSVAEKSETTPRVYSDAERDAKLVERLRWHIARNAERSLKGAHDPPAGEDAEYRKLCDEITATGTFRAKLIWTRAQAPIQAAVGKARIVPNPTRQQERTRRRVMRRFVRAERSRFAPLREPTLRTRSKERAPRSRFRASRSNASRNGPRRPDDDEPPNAVAPRGAA